CGGVEEVYCWRLTPIRCPPDGIPEVGLLKEAELTLNTKEQRDLDLRVLGSSCLDAGGLGLPNGFLAAFINSDSSLKVRSPLRHIKKKKKRKKKKALKGENKTNTASLKKISRSHSTTLP